MSNKRNLDFLINFKVQGAKAINDNKESLKDMGNGLKDVINNMKGMGSGFNNTEGDIKNFKESTDKLDNSLTDLNKKLKDVNDDTGKLGDTNDVASKSYVKMALKLASIVAIAAGVTIGIKKMISAVSNSVNVMSDLYTVSTKTGVSFENLQGASSVLGEMGVSINEYASGVRRLNRLANVSDLYGIESYAGIFRQLNIDYGEFSKMKPEKQFEEFAKAYNSINDSQGKAILDRLGIRNLELPLKNIEAIKENFESLNKAGLIMSSKDGAGLGSMADSIAKIKNEWLLVFGIVGSKIAPKIGEIISGFSLANKEGKGLAETAESIGEALVSSIDKMREIFNVVSSMFNTASFALNIDVTDMRSMQDLAWEIEDFKDAGIDIIQQKKDEAKAIRDNVLNIKKYLSDENDAYNDAQIKRREEAEKNGKEFNLILDSVENDRNKLSGKTAGLYFSGKNLDSMLKNDRNNAEKYLKSGEKLLKDTEKEIARLTASQGFFDGVDNIIDIKSSDGSVKEVEDEVKEGTGRIITVIKDFKEELVLINSDLELITNKNAFLGISGTKEGLDSEIKATEDYLKKISDMYESQDYGISENDFYKISNEGKNQLSELKKAQMEIKSETFKNAKESINDIEKYMLSVIPAPNGVLYTTRDLIEAINNTIAEGYKIIPEGGDISEMIALEHKKNLLETKVILDDINEKIAENIELEKLTDDDLEKNNLLKVRKVLLNDLLTESKKNRFSRLEELKIERMINEVNKEQLKIKNKKSEIDELELIKLREGANKFDKNDSTNNEIKSLKLQTVELEKRLKTQKEIADSKGEEYINSKEVLQIEREIEFNKRKILDINTKISDDSKANAERLKQEAEKVKQDKESERLTADGKILDLRIRLLEVTNKDVEANKLKYQNEREEIIKTIKDQEMQNEALNLFDKIFDSENLAVKLNETQALSAKLKNEYENTSIFNHERLIELKMQILELDGEEARLKEELNIKTDEQVEKQFLTMQEYQDHLTSVFNVLTSSIAEVANGTKTLKEGMLDFFKSTLDMIAKMIQELLVAKIVEASMSMFGGGGGGGGGISSLMKFHTGGVVGNSGNDLTGFKGLKSNEVVAVLEKGEAVLTEKQQQNVSNSMSGSKGQGVTNVINNVIDVENLGRSITSTKEFKDGLFKVLQSDSKQIANIINS